jgi:general secretion pathway protein A
MGVSPDRSGTADFYGFVDPPFSLAPDLGFFFESDAHRTALDALKQSIADKRAFTILTGDHGMGKTTICRALVERLDPRTFSSCVFTPIASFADLLQAMLVDFGVLSREGARSGRVVDRSAHCLLGALHDFLLSIVPIGANAVLIVDDAHQISGELLEEIRLLSNLEADDAKLLQIVLVGQPDLLDRLGDEEALALDQRISRRTDLTPLTQADVDGYIAHRLAVAQSGSAVTFDRRAIDAVHTFSGGTPRLVNQLCEGALGIGAEQQRRVITAGAVEQAATILGLRRASTDGSRWSWRRLVAASPS